MTEGWIEWNGGECPVPEDTLVEVELRYGHRPPHPDAAKQFWWGCNGNAGDIFRYRVVSAAPVPSVRIAELEAELAKYKSYNEANQSDLVLMGIVTDSLEAENKRLREALIALVNATALSGVRAQVAGWNGEGREEGPFQRHPSRLCARIETNCGRIYALDETLQAARAVLNGGGDEQG